MSYLKDALENFQDLTKKPEQFLSNDENICPKIESFIKTSYDFTKGQEFDSFKSNALPELITQNFDIEQIWQQVDLQNDAFLTHSLVNVSKFLVAKNKNALIFDEVQQLELQGIHDEEEDTTEEENEEQVEDNSDSDESSSSDEDDNEPLNLAEDSDALNSEDLTDNEDNSRLPPIKKLKFAPSIVDDKFFKLNEMEAFLQAEEKKLNDEDPDSGNDSEDNEEMEDDDEEDIDLFKPEILENTSTERGGSNNPKYKDFFIGEEQDQPSTSKRNKFLEEIENDEDNDQIQEDNEFLEDKRENFGNIEDFEQKEIELKSTLEEREERLKRKMHALEEAAISEKPWQLKGEITAEGRPQNSLLEQVVEFDLSARPAPVITEEISLQLDDIIRQRVKDKAFDSVQRKEKPVETPWEYKKKLVLDQEKSKESLAQIYEKEYLKQTEAVNANSNEEPTEEEEPQLHKDIKKMMHGLFTKLDALSNFHFTPKPVQTELKVVSNLPAISMEEVAPVATSDAALLAPEEIKRKVRGDIIGASERSTTDKKRERRKKKDKQHEHAVLKHKKGNNLGLGNKYSKEKAKDMLEQVTKDKNVDKMDETSGKSVKSSTAFFEQLEDEVKKQVHHKNSAKKKQVKQQFDAKKMKL